MPKKHTYNFKNLQGSSSSTSTQNKNGENNASPSVNERLGELRKLQRSKAAQKNRELAEQVNQRSVPPHLRGILGMPESAPPKPKREVRVRERLRTPGPAPPKSWLRDSASAWPSYVWINGLGAKRQVKKGGADSNFARNRPKILLRFQCLCGLEGDKQPEGSPPSLSHIMLKKIAENWDLLDSEDYAAFIDVPIRLRVRLLSYIQYYGPTISSTALEVLLEGSNDLLCLDLASFIGYRGLTLKRVMKVLESSKSKAPTKEVEDIAESWDVNDVTVDTTSQLSTLSLGHHRLTNLTHLCLSHPAPNGASWRDLLVLLKRTPQLTHLSLASWPRPTLTPNLVTTTVPSRVGPGEIHAGGSHYYSDLDQDLSEPVTLLRQLSANLLCLEWLDLEGCTGWVSALGAMATHSFLSGNDSGPRRDVRRVADEWSLTPSQAPSVFVSHWSRLSYLRISQGWLPTRFAFEMFAASQQTNDLGSFAWETIPGLPELSASILEDLTKETIAFEKKRAQIWLEAERKLVEVRQQINSVRRLSGYPTIEIVHDLVGRESWTR